MNTANMSVLGHIVSMLAIMGTDISIDLLCGTAISSTARISNAVFHGVASSSDHRYVMVCYNL